MLSISGGPRHIWTSLTWIVSLGGSTVPVRGRIRRLLWSVILWGLMLTGVLMWRLVLLLMGLILRLMSWSCRRLSRRILWCHVGMVRRLMLY
jgi:hypothetical protein